MATGEAPRRALGIWAGALLMGLVGALIGAAAISWLNRDSTRDYLLANPEVLPEAMDRLRAREAADVISAHRAEIEAPFGGAWAGAEKGDVTLVEFFDYACGYCRKSNPDVDRLLKEDPKLKVVWREWPVLGPESEAAARASLAAAQAGRYRLFYDRLFALGRPSAETVADAARVAGIDPAAVPGGAEAELQKNLRLAQAIGATGTPTFVVGDQVLQGAVGYEALKEAVEEARARS